VLGITESQWHRGLFVAGSDFESFPIDKREARTVDDVVDHYGNKTYYYSKDRAHSLIMGASECHWRRGQSLNFDTKEEAEEYVENNESQLSSAIDRDVKRVELEYNDETEEYEVIPSDNDGVPAR
jgi:hypothetical protein